MKAVLGCVLLLAVLCDVCLAAYNSEPSREAKIATAVLIAISWFFFFLYVGLLICVTYCCLIVPARKRDAARRQNGASSELPHVMTSYPTNSTYM